MIYRFYEGYPIRDSQENLQGSLGSCVTVSLRGASMEGP